MPVNPVRPAACGAGCSGSDARGRRDGTMKRRRPGARHPRNRLVIIGAAQVVAALRAHQLAAVAAQPAAARGAHLAVVLHWRLAPGGACRTTLWEIGRKIGVKGARPLRQHAGEISIEKWALGRAALRGVPQALTLRRSPHFPLDGACNQPNFMKTSNPKEGLWQARLVRFGQVH